MQTVELFSGRGSFSKVALDKGYSIRTYDIDPLSSELKDGTHSVCDVLDDRVLYPFDARILWASPPCNAFSVAAIGKNWDKITREPTTKTAEYGLAVLYKTIQLIDLLEPNWFFIENPRGMMRKKIDRIFTIFGITAIRHTVSYCQYGDNRQKPTDIWTNAHWWHSKPICKPCAPCHEAAPRGSSTGTQGIKDKRERSAIPAALFVEIFEDYQNHLEQNIEG